jgi:hypothetical protein
MIIEITGIPGSGKSTVIEALRKNNINEKIIFDVRNFILKKYNLKTSSLLLYDCILFLNLFKLKFSDWRLFLFILALIYRSANTKFNKLNILRNFFKKITIFRCIENEPFIFFVDEGLCHLPFNIFVDEKDLFDFKELLSLIELIPQSNKVLVIDAPDNEILCRVISRGSSVHRRMNFKSKHAIEQFLNQSRHVLNHLKHRKNIVLYMNTQEDIDCNHILWSLNV